MSRSSFLAPFATARSAPLLVLAALSLLCLAPSGAEAAWPHDPDSGNLPLCTATGDQQYPTSVSDGAGGAIVTWHDQRTGAYDIAAQRIERFGHLGNPEPSIVKVRDVQKDQGGRVSIQWNASTLDVVPGGVVDVYWIWRQVPIGASRLKQTGCHPPTARIPRGRGCRSSEGNPSAAPGGAPGA